jgi:cbb3-type cytochrome oxidase cytochrome c subunit
VFARSGCTACHTYLGSGSSNLGAPDLSAIGRGQNAAFFKQYVADPSKFGNNVMPKFASLGDKLLTQLSVFLEASKGPK